MSVGRSALALSVLTILSGWHDEYADFFIGISKIEPIFHLESVVMTLDDARPEKKFTLLLIKLAKANVIALDSRQPSAEIAQDVRQRFLNLLNDQK